MRRLVPLLFIALFGAGCLGAKESPILLAPYLAITETAPGDALDVALRLTSTSPFKQTLGASAEAPEGWNATLESANVTIRGRADLPFLLHIDTGSNATYGAHDLVVHLGDSAFQVPVIVRDLREGRVAETSIVQLRVSRFDDNGTVVATDDPLVRTNATAAGSGPLAGASEDARALALRAPALREGEARAARDAQGGVLLVRLARIES